MFKHADGEDSFIIFAKDKPTQSVSDEYQIIGLIGPKGLVAVRKEGVR